ncbi:hypothetical protein [Kineosporia sp. NBRC 101731]|uniref:hypothetical protein n=1 Tax=Kineosporia sp. NBRC 101731 TaxID=3032199 RepID=UPI0024A5558B|nr:hypothetical protein [Kineosporia sp. NBRC 101731]GLY32147.1 hypothetical protein Kisp02_55120 [Kineosporia sp. NBRC 101731]
MHQIPTDPADDLEGAVRELLAQGIDIRRQVDGLTSEMRRRTMAFVVAILAGALILGVLGTAAYLVSLNNRRAIAENNIKFCGLVESSASSFPAPSTPRGAALQKTAAQLLTDLECDEQ